jgi:predicted phage terminase large subunit-like protein
MTIASVSPWEAAAKLFEPPVRPPRRWASPLEMACDLDPTMVRTPALDVIDQALVDIYDGRIPQTRLAVHLAPQEGKSTLCSYWHPLWLLVNDPDLRIIIVSYSDEIARRWGSEIKRALETFNGDEGTVDLGLRLREDSRAAGRWQIEGHRGGAYCAGVGGQITGRAADYVCVDDPLKNLEEAQSAKYRERGMRTWQGTLVPRMAPATKVVWVQTLWHEAEPIQQILAVEAVDWKVISIPAIADSRDDPLGREIGQAMQSARGERDWARIRRDVGEYVFAALYQQRPAPAEGGLFKRLWWRHWTPAPSAGLGERVDCAGRIWPLQNCWRFITGDLAASTRTSADWTVAAAWALSLDGDLILLDRVRARVGEANHFDVFRPLAERWQVDTAFVEKSFHSSTLAIDATRDGLHITPIEAESDKFSRALPYSARVSAGRVWLPASAPWLEEWVGEHAAFPNGSHDDQVDTGAYATRVAVTKWSPVAPQALRRSDAELDYMTTPM